MVEKNTQSLRPIKFRFSPIAPECTSTRLQITQNLVEDLFLCILYNFEVKWTFFSEARINNSKMMILPPKIHHRPFESYKNGWYHQIGLKIW